MKEEFDELLEKLGIAGADPGNIDGMTTIRQKLESCEIETWESIKGDCGKRIYTTTLVLGDDFIGVASRAHCPVHNLIQAMLEAQERGWFNRLNG